MQRDDVCRGLHPCGAAAEAIPLPLLPTVAVALQDGCLQSGDQAAYLRRRHRVADLHTSAMSWIITKKSCSSPNFLYLFNVFI